MTAPVLGLSVRSPFGPRPAPVGVAEAVARAGAEAGAVPGAFAESPVRFDVLADAAYALVAPLRPEGPPRTGVLVTVRTAAEPDHRAHLRERSRTAAQRFVLALACEGVDGAWAGEGVPDAAAFRAAGVDLGGREPVGLVWCAAG